jgi:hypothetical protein
VWFVMYAAMKHAQNMTSAMLKHTSARALIQNEYYVTSNDDWKDERLLWFGRNGEKVVIFVKTGQSPSKGTR